jgi:hypothetical protein
MFSLKHAGFKGKKKRKRKYRNIGNNGCFFKFGVEESIVNAPPDYNTDLLFKSNLTFCVVCVFNLQFEKFVIFRRVVYSQSTLQHQLRRQI